MNTSLKLVAALAVVAGVSGSSAVAMQGGQQKEVTYFYDDEQHTNLVGGTLVYCDGSHSHWAAIRFTPIIIISAATESLWRPRCTLREYF